MPHANNNNNDNRNNGDHQYNFDYRGPTVITATATVHLLYLMNVDQSQTNTRSPAVAEMADRTAYYVRLQSYKFYCDTDMWTRLCIIKKSVGSWAEPFYDFY